MKTISVAATVVCLVVYLISTVVCAQTKEEGLTLLNEAQKHYKQAQTTEEVKKAVERYEAILLIFLPPVENEGQ